jgi:hypothetical protein
MEQDKAEKIDAQGEKVDRIRPPVGEAPAGEYRETRPDSVCEEFEHKLEEALGLVSEDYGQNDMGYPDPTEAKPSTPATTKGTSAKGAHRFDPAVKHDKLPARDEFDNEDERIDFDRKKPEKLSRPTSLKPKKQLPKLD